MPAPKPKPIHVKFNDNTIALLIVFFSGVLSVFALLEGVDNETAKTALAVSASGFSGVIGYIGGKARREEDQP
jgi:hypothetical protein